MRLLRHGAACALQVLGSFSGLYYQMQCTAHVPSVSDDNPRWLQVAVKVPRVREIHLPSVQWSDGASQHFPKGQVVISLVDVDHLTVEIPSSVFTAKQQPQAMGE